MEAAEFTFKLMNYIKLNGNSFKIFLKFYLKSLPKVFLFLVIFFTFELQIENYGIFNENKYSFYNNLINNLKEKECFSENPLIIFNFPYLLYSDNDVEKYTKCFQHVFVNLNIFFCFTFFVFVFYLLMRIRKRLIEYMLIGFFFVLFSSIYLSFIGVKINNFHLSVIQGEVISLKQFHLFLIKYFFGVLTGLFFFYSTDILRIDSFLNNKNNYAPFEFICWFIIKFLKEKKKKIEKKISMNSGKSSLLSTFLINKNSNRTTKSTKRITNSESSKYYPVRKLTFNTNESKEYEFYLKEKTFVKNYVIILIISLLSMIFIAIYGFLKLRYEIQTYKSLPIPLFLDLWILYVYERYLFLISFLCFIITLSSISINIGNFKVLPKSKFFLIFGRINLAYFSMLELIVLFFFSVNNIQLYFSFQILFTFSIGIGISLYSVSFFFVYLFELPLKVMMKYKKKY